MSPLRFPGLGENPVPAGKGARRGGPGVFCVRKRVWRFFLSQVGKGRQFAGRGCLRVRRAHPIRACRSWIHGESGPSCQSSDRRRRERRPLRPPLRKVQSGVGHDPDPFAPPPTSISDETPQGFPLRVLAGSRDTVMAGLSSPDPSIAVAMRERFSYHGRGFLRRVKSLPPSNCGGEGPC